MNSRPIFSLVIVVVFSCIFNNLVLGQEQQKKINVDVYYESLCPDSMYFINKQLTPAYNRGLKNYLNVNFIPFGKSSSSIDKQTNKISFVCQHGEDECTGNKAQACAIDEIEKTMRLEDRQQKMIDIVDCAMNNRNYENFIISRCAQNHGFDEQFIQKIERCSESSTGDELLLLQERKTVDAFGVINFVPKIVINGVESKESFTNFAKVICNLIPSGNQLSACH